MATRQRFHSNVAIHPGELLADELAERGMTQYDLARKMGRPYQVINGIIHGKKRITAETALQLEQVIEVPAHIWLGLQSEYDLTLARLAAAGRSES